MNKLTLLFLFGAALLIVGCEDRETPYNEFEDLEYGAIPRLVNPPSGVFDYFNPDESEVSFTVEFYDENQGRNVASYSWDVAYNEEIAEELDITPESYTIEVDTVITGTDTTEVRDTTSFTPADTVVLVEAQSINYGPVDLVTVEKSAFETNDAGLPTATLTFTLNQVLDALGIPIDSVDGGNNFTFTGTLTKDNGKSYGAENTAGNLQGQPAFAAFFEFDQALVCPSDLGGTYIATSEGESTDGCCAGTFTSTGREVTLNDEGNGVYTISDFSGGLYFTWYGPEGGDYGIDEEFISGGGLAQTAVDACNTFRIASFSEPFGETASAEGLVDPATGVITYTFVNGYGDTGRVILTPK